MNVVKKYHQFKNVKQSCFKCKHYNKGTRYCNKLFCTVANRFNGKCSDFEQKKYKKKVRKDGR